MNRLVLGLAAVQAIDAVAVAIPVKAIKADLDRLAVPAGVQRALPVIKGAAAVGLLIPPLSELTATALCGYFVCALGVHARAKDPAWRYGGAAGLLLWSAAARRSVTNA